MQLSQRLKTVAQLLPPQKIYADIGADRGELAYALLTEGKVKKAILSDISASSLRRAQDLFAGDPLRGRVSFRIGSGLKVLAPREVGYAVLAGMGGATIVQILQDSPTVFANLEGLVIQAMGNSTLVRQFLMKHHFAITAEEILEETGHFYQIIQAKPGAMNLTAAQIYAGPLLLKNKHPVLKTALLRESNYATSLLTHLKEEKQGAKRQKELESNLLFIQEILAQLEGN